METPHRAATRAALLAAAEEQFAAHGYIETSHADIAIAAGIGRTTFYEYFPSKEELLVSLVEDRLPALSHRILESIPVELEPSQRLALLTRRMIDFVATDHLGLLLHSEVPRLGDDAQRRIAAAHGELSEAFVALCTEGAAAGRFRSLPPRFAARLIYEVIMTAGRTLMAAEDRAQHVDALADDAVRFLLHGLSVEDEDVTPESSPRARNRSATSA